jgi:ribosomal protein S27AE
MTEHLFTEPQRKILTSIIDKEIERLKRECPMCLGTLAIDESTKGIAYISCTSCDYDVTEPL